MRKNQKGFTLVELIIAVAILAIVTLAVSGFIVVGSRSYTSANTDIMLQQDAQLALNQISDVIIDTTDSINYGVRAGGVGDMQLVLKDSEFGGEATEKCLAVVNKNEAGSTNDNVSYWFYWSKDDETIYFNKVDAYSSTMSTSEIQSAFEAAADQNQVSILAQHVTDFSVDLTQFDANRVVMITATFENGNRVYSTSNNVTVRNRVALNELTVGPLKRAEEFVINTVTSVTLEPGDTFSLASKATVTTPSSDQAITFEQVGGTQYGTSVSSDGMVIIGKEDMRENFAVKVSRTNEQYEGENDRIAKTIRVNIKRATTVNISGPASAKQGDTVDLTGKARGNMLGERCDQCIGDDLSMDWDVYEWKIISGGESAQITASGNSAAVKIDTNAAVGSKIVIQAASVLSRDKNGGYGPASAPTVPPVTGIWEITVEKGTTGDYPIKGDLLYGSDNDPGIYDYMREELETDYGTYIICARIREVNATHAGNDLVVMYRSLGANIRFFPDIFGLKLDRDYKVFFQVLDPVSKETRAKKARNEIWGYYEDAPEDIVDEYIHHTDDITGEYTGDVYYAGALYSGMLRVPTITVKYNGITYPNNLQDYYESVYMINGGGNILGRIELGDAVNITKDQGGTGILNKMEYSIYKDGEPLYVYDKDKMQYVGDKSYADNRVYLDPPNGNPMIKTQGGEQLPQKVYGTYTIVPGFRYANSLSVRDYQYIYPLKNGSLDTELFKEHGAGDYSEHYYEQKMCTVTVLVHRNHNLTLTLQNKKKAKINIPLPTDEDFSLAWSWGFKLESSEPQTAYNKWLDYYDAETGEKLGQVGINVTCEYNPSKKQYNLVIYNTNGKYFGTYGWTYGDKVWSLVDSGDADNWW